MKVDNVCIIPVEPTPCLLNVGIGQQICQELAHRIMVIDGAMGTMIQSYKLDEDDFRGEYSFGKILQPSCL